MARYYTPFAACDLLARNDVATTFENRKVSINLLRNDTADAGTPVIQKLGGGPAKAGDVIAQKKTPYGLLKLKLNPNGTVVFEPSKALEALKAGELYKIAFKYTIADSLGQKSSALVTVNVKGLNSTPTITTLGQSGPTASVLELLDASKQDLDPIKGFLRVSDADTGNTLTAKLVGGPVLAYSAGTLPAGAAAGLTALTSGTALAFGSAVSNGGTRTINWTYDPSAANLDFLAAGETLTITYQVRVSDGTSQSAIQTLRFSIVGTNDAPVARDDQAVTKNDLPVLIDVLANDSDLDANDDLTITGATNGQHGTVAVVNGKLRYTPDGEFIGTDTFTYTISDGKGGTSTATVNVVVSAGENTVPTLTVPGAGAPGTSVSEAGLPARLSEPAGSNAQSSSETTTGVVAFNAQDGVGSVTIGNTSYTPAQLLAGVAISDATGTLTISGYAFNAQTGAGSFAYTYTLKDNTIGDSTQASFAITVKDTDGESASSNLVIKIQDDSPLLSDDVDSIADGSPGPATGNVLTGLDGGLVPDGNVTDGIADVLGADGGQVTGIRSVNAGGADLGVPAGGATIAGQYGELTIRPDGSYSYSRSAVLTTTVIFASEESGYKNVLGVDGDAVGETLPEGPGSRTFTYLAADAETNSFVLVNPDTEEQLVRYFTDFNGNGIKDGSDAEIFEGKADAFTFDDLGEAAEEYGTTEFVVAFEDGGAPDRDFNDFVATIRLGPPAGVEDVFAYTVKDGDGDLAWASLRIGLGSAAGDLP